MRKMLTGLTLLVLTAITGLANPVLAPPAPQCSTLGIGPANDISIPFATWTDASFFCQQEDKIFSNFSASGSIPTNTVLEIQQQQVGPVDLHAVTFNGNFLNAFGVSYDIAVDLTQFGGLNRIVRVSGDLSNPSDLGNPTNVRSVFTEGSVLLGTVISTMDSPGSPLVVDATALHVANTYSPLGGAAVSISNTFAEQQTPETPEPVTFAMVGAALLVISRMKRILQ
jgi:hypothetical protein